MADDREGMNQLAAEPYPHGGRRGFSGWQVFGIVLLTVIATAGVSSWLLANDPDLARRVAFDLSDDLLSVVLLVPVEEGLPVLGGWAVRVHARVELAYHEGEPVVRLMGVSVMGIPLPSAWLGDLRNVNLIEEFGTEPGFWRSFADGVADLRVEDGQLRIEFNE